MQFLELPRDHAAPPPLLGPIQLGTSPSLYDLPHLYSTVIPEVSLTNYPSQVPFNSSSPELSRSPFVLGSLPGSASIPYSWSPSPLHSIFGPAPPVIEAASQSTTASATASGSYIPPSVNPWANATIGPSRKRKSDAPGKTAGSSSRKERGTDNSSEAADREGAEGGSGQAGNSRGYARWDTKREDGLSVEACLVQWMPRDGNWRSWKDAKSTGERDKCLRSINAHITAEGFQERTCKSG